MKRNIPAVQIALADSSNLARSCLKTSIETNSKYKVILEATSGQDLITQLKTRKAHPDVCIIELSMDNLNGYETILVIKKMWAEMKTIIISKYDNEFLISKILGVGADSYLSHECNATAITEAIDQVVMKGHYYTDRVSKLVFGKANNKKAITVITDKELHYLCLCCTDLGYKEIGPRMGVRKRTVDNYHNSLSNKLKINTRAGMAMFAIGNNTHLHASYLHEI